MSKAETTELLESLREHYNEVISTRATDSLYARSLKDVIYWMEHGVGMGEAFDIVEQKLRNDKYDKTAEVVKPRS